PLCFHDIHGENIRLNADKTRATRYESFCKGICFSNRPIAVNEKVYINFAEVSTSWSGVLRFGFTGTDPMTYNPVELPRYACPDLTNKPGTFAKALSERFAKTNTVMCFYVTRGGDVFFSVNGEDKGLFFNGVNTNGPLWALLDIYGNTISVEFLHRPGKYQNKFIVFESELFSFQTLSLNDSTSLPVRYHANVELTPMTFHAMCGRNVRLNPDMTIASRTMDEYCNAYAFTSRPLHCGEKIVIQILNIEQLYVGGIAFGLTVCDPASLIMDDLPDDSDYLLDRKEYWVVNKDICRKPDVGDELSFYLTSEGEVRYSRNNHKVATLMHVDRNLPLWAFFDVYGNVQKIKILELFLSKGMPNEHTQIHWPSRKLYHYDARQITMLLKSCRARLHVCLQFRFSCTHIIVIKCIIGTTIPGAQSRMPRSRSASSYSSLTVALPPRQPTSTTATQSLPPPLQPQVLRSISVPATQSSDCQPASPAVPSILAPLHPSLPTSLPSSSTSTPTSVDTSFTDNTDDNQECSVCCERSVNSVLYTCGHMCMCFDCALIVKREKGGLCPICRQPIKDVIKTYRS
ncbi:hypothetical protein LOTGIDRAFT_117454, partial [Lottia gigantea]